MSNYRNLLEKLRPLSSPVDYHADLKWLLNRDMSKKMMEENPDCFMSIKRGNSGFFLPICNRLAIKDPRIINMSLKIVDRLGDDPEIDEEELSCVRFKLQRLLTRYDKGVPTPPRNAYRKGVSTRQINKIKRDMDNIRGGE